MKKYILICVLFVLMTFGFAASNYKHSCYSVKCAKCVEEQHKSHILPGVARRANEPYKKIDGKVYALYKCDYGHIYWAELK